MLRGSKITFIGHLYIYIDIYMFFRKYVTQLYDIKYFKFNSNNFLIEFV